MMVQGKDLLLPATRKKPLELLIVHYIVSGSIGALVALGLLVV